jgi:hypothetical protein
LANPLWNKRQDLSAFKIPKIGHKVSLAHGLDIAAGIDHALSIGE